jgi:hypothetical protein
MQECSISIVVLSVGVGALLDRYPVVASILLLGMFFLVGYAEATIIKSRLMASLTWFTGLAAASIWIAYSGTPMRIATGIGVFLCGMAALIIFNRKRPKAGGPDTGREE